MMRVRQEHSDRFSHDSGSRTPDPGHMIQDPGHRTTATGSATTQYPGVDIDTKKTFGGSWVIRNMRVHMYRQTEGRSKVSPDSLSL